MNGRQRPWALAVVGLIALLTIGGAAFANAHHHDAGRNSIANAARGVAAQSKGHVVHLDLARFTKHKTRHNPADDQYENPLAGKLCANPTALTFFFAGISTRDDFLMLTNCGNVPVTITPPRKRVPTSPFRPNHQLFDNSNNCPIQGFLDALTLQPGDYCVLQILFGPQSPTDPSPPAGRYSDDWTFAGDTASIVVRLSGTLPTS
jgi:hypothetical protein